MKSIIFLLFNALNIIYSLKLDCEFAESFNLTDDSTYELAVPSALPPNSFIIGSFEDSPTLSFKSSDSSWTESLTYYSLPSYLQSINTLQLTPPTSGSYSFSICSFNSSIKSSTNLNLSVINRCPLNCRNQGVCQNNSCTCITPFFGEDCSLSYIKVRTGFSKSFKIPGYSLKSFKFLSSNPIYIKQKEKTVHIFKHSKKIIPSFFEYGDYSNPGRSFETKGGTKFFSIFCPQPTPCIFKLHEKEVQASYVLFTVLICVLSPVVVVIIIVIGAYIKKRRAQERLNRCLSSNEIHKYAPLTKLEEELENDICSICLSKLEKNEGLRRITICSHYFHPACLEGWLKIKAKCPNCNINLS